MDVRAASLAVVQGRPGWLEACMEVVGTDCRQLAAPPPGLGPCQLQCQQLQRYSANSYSHQQNALDSPNNVLCGIDKTKTMQN